MLQDIVSAAGSFPAGVSAGVSAGEAPINFEAHRVRVNSAGARLDFEQMIGQLVRAILPAAEVRSIEANPGDWGIDVFVGDLNGSTSIWQAKYFIDGVGESQKQDIRDSFASVLKNSAEQGFKVDRWVLCIPRSMDGPTAKWWDGWKRKKVSETGILVELWDETELRGLLSTPSADSVRRQYYDPRPTQSRAEAASHRPPNAVRVRDADPYRLGVHRAIQLAGAADDFMPDYVDRDVDYTSNGIRTQLRAGAIRGGFVLLLGGSSVGKTRCAVEAVRSELPDWWLIHPASTGEIAALAAVPPARTVLWLDEIQKYLREESGLTDGMVRAMLGAGMVLVGTIWPRYYRAFAALPSFDLDGRHQRERDILRLASIIEVDGQFSAAERARAQTVAVRDRRIQIGLDSTDDGLTQTLAAGPELLRRWTSAKDDEPYSWSVITAAFDAVRLGVHTPLTSGLLRAAAPGYWTRRQFVTAPCNWYEHALGYATTQVRGASAILNPDGSDIGHPEGYTVADYLLQHANAIRRYDRPPASLWTALRDHAARADLTRLSHSALDYRAYGLAVPLLQRRAAANDRHAAERLADLLAEAGDLEGLRGRADVGDDYAAGRLVRLLAGLGDRAELRQRAESGDGYAADRLARLFVEAEDRPAAIEILRPHADAGDWQAASQLASLLAGLGDRAELRQRAESGDGYAADRLAWLFVEAEDLPSVIDVLRPHAPSALSADTVYRIAELFVEAGNRSAAIEVLRPHADPGDWRAPTDDDEEADPAALLVDLLAGARERNELRRRADGGDEYAARRLVELLAEIKDLDGLRELAGSGDESAASKLVDLLVASGNHDELHGRAEDGDGYAAFRLARLFVEARDRPAAIEILRPHADAGDWQAASQLASLLAEQGDLDALRGRADGGDHHAAHLLVDLLAGAGGRNELQRRADGGDEYAARRLVELLAEVKDLAGLCGRADGGDRQAARRLVDLLAEQGDLDGLRERADGGDHYAADQVANLFVEAGDRPAAIEVLRPHADALFGREDLLAAGIHNHLRPRADRLASMLADEGDLVGLRERADGGDEYAARWLVDLLAIAGDRDELHRLADVGDRYAAGRLADLLASEGDDRLRRYGFDMSGRIADSPTWQT